MKFNISHININWTKNLIKRFLIILLFAFSKPSSSQYLTNENIDITIYLDMNHPAASDSNTGNDPANPKKTLRNAFDAMVTSINNGKATRLLISSGVYRLDRSLKLENLTPTGKETLMVIEAVEDKAVTISGSMTSGWEPETWTLVDSSKNIYKHKWSYDWGFHSEGYYTIQHILLHRREMVFINDSLLKPVILERFNYTDEKGKVYNDVGLLIDETNPDGKAYYEYKDYTDHDILKPGEFGIAELGPGDTLYDGHPDPNTIFIRLPGYISSLDSAKIEIPVAKSLISLLEPKNNLVIRGLVFKHAASFYNTHWDKAAIWTRGVQKYSGNNWLIENCDFLWNNSIGASLPYRTNSIIRNCRFIYAGNFGVTVTNGKNIQYDNVEAQKCNWRGKLVEYALHSTGGIDISGDTISLIGCRALNNYGYGIRFDVHGTHVNIENCSSSYNFKGGMFHEIEWGPIWIKNSSFIGNEGKGLLFLNAHQVTIKNSCIGDNTETQISFYNSESRTTKISVDDPTEIPIPNILDFEIYNSKVWSTKGDSSYLIERTYGVGSHSAYMSFIETEFTGDNNVYWNPSNENVFEISQAFFKRDFTGLTGWKSATGSEQNSVWIELIECNMEHDSLVNDIRNEKEYSGMNKKNTMVYPNPFCEYSFIKSTETILNIHLINSQGELLEQHDIARKEAKLNLSHLKSGIYLLQVQTEKGNFNYHRIIKY